MRNIFLELGLCLYCSYLSSIDKYEHAKCLKSNKLCYNYRINLISCIDFNYYRVSLYHRIYRFIMFILFGFEYQIKEKGQNMSYKTRSNYAPCYKLTEEEFKEIFKNEDKNINNDNITPIVKDQTTDNSNKN